MIAAGRNAERIPFAGLPGEDFDWITAAALRAAADNPDNVFGAVLALLAGCHSAPWTAASECRGANHSQLRAVADALGMGPGQREEWELLAESVALSERHVLHIIGALSEAAA